MLGQRNIFNTVIFNPLKYEQKTRETSGQHKAHIISEYNTRLKGIKRIAIHFEDDEVQAKIIRERCPDVTVVMLVHDLVNKENQRHVNF